jgi:protein phosphatase
MNFCYLNRHEKTLLDNSSLQVNIGSVSNAGVKPTNEDAVNFYIPTQTHQLEYKGICCALADGVSTAEAGQEASLQSVTRFIDDYYKAPDTWSVSHSGQKVLSATNLSLFKKSHQFTHESKGYLCTFVGLVFKSQIAHFFHVGDSRIYLFRGGQLKQLTQDHSTFIGGGKSYLTRALGMDNNLHVDYGKLELQEGDQFILSSDGLHEFVTEPDIVKVLDSELSEQQQAESLLQLSIKNGSDDNISCIVACVKQISNQSLDDLTAKLTRLPFPPDLQPGMILDEYIVIKELFASPRSQLYLVKDEQTQNLLVMKTPSINYSQDTAYIDRFIQEEWIGKRITSDKVVKIIEQSRPRTCLYYLMEYVEGIGLDDWINSHPLPSPKAAIAIVKQIAAGLKAFHDNETIHQDLRPANILISQNNEIKIVDFGSTFVAGTAELFNPIHHEGALGTATYSDPQYLLGKNPGIQGDLYALATISYELFTGHLPYGEKVEECKTAFDYDHLRYKSATYHNPLVPIWFDRALEKGVQMDTEKRYLTIPQFLQDLTHPNPDFLLNVPESANKHNAMVFWGMLSGSMLLLLFIVITMFNSG